MKDSLLDPEHRGFEDGLRRAGRDVHMSPAARAKTLAALGLGAAGVTAASTAHAAGASFWTSKGALWTALGTFATGSVIAVATIGPLAGDGHENEPPKERVERATEMTFADATTEEPHEAEANEVPETAPFVEDSETSVALERSRRPSTPKPERSTVERGETTPPPPAASTLGQEVAHLGKVEAALASGDPARALSILEEYRARFVPKRLGLEAEVLTIQALHDSGSRATARERAQKFLQRHPSSPLGAKARQYLR